MLAPRRYYSFRLLGSEIWLKLHCDGASPGELAEQLMHIATKMRHPPAA